MSGIILDLFVILFISVMAFVYMRKGFFRALFSFVTFFISFYISALLQPIIEKGLIFLGVGSEGSSRNALIISLIIYFIISAVLIVLFFVVGKILDIFAKFPVIKQLNATGGLIVGGLLGIVICFFVFYAISVGNVWLDTAKITDIIESSYISKIFYQNNLLFVLQ